MSEDLSLAPIILFIWRKSIEYTCQLFRLKLCPISWRIAVGEIFKALLELLWKYTCGSMKPVRMSQIYIYIEWLDSSDKLCNSCILSLWYPLLAFFLKSLYVFLVACNSVFLLDHSMYYCTYIVLKCICCIMYIHMLCRNVHILYL